MYIKCRCGHRAKYSDFNLVSFRNELWRCPKCLVVFNTQGKTLLEIIKANPFNDILYPEEVKQNFQNRQLISCYGTARIVQ